MALPEVVKFLILLESPIADSGKWQNFVYESKELIKMINKLETRAEITVTDNFDKFINTLSRTRIDCFVFDWNYKECDILALIGKIRKSTNFNNSTMIVLSDKKDAVNPNQYSLLNINMAVSRPIFFDDFTNELKKYLEKKFAKLIPEHYNVLIVDDVPEIVELVEGYLGRLEHKNITKAYTVEEAKKLFETQDFDLLILDQNLSDGTCYDLIRYQRIFENRPRLLNALVIVITGTNSIENTMNLRMNQIGNQIIKPFDFFEFQEKLTYALVNYKKL